MKIDIFFHVANIEGYRPVFELIDDRIKKSGILQSARSYNICSVGDPIPEPVYASHPDVTERELFTLRKAWEFACKNPDSAILFMHTKGIRGNDNPCIIDWREMMIYWCIDKWQYAINKLKEGYDACGTDLRDYPFLHFAGMWYWVTSKHLSSMPDPMETRNLETWMKYQNPQCILEWRHGMEGFICSKNDGKYYCLYDCSIPTFERHIHRHDSSNYINILPNLT